MADFENLVLLVGTNPLPNYVAAEYFIENNQKLKNIFLIYSEKGDFQDGTMDLAKNLERVLKKRYANKLNFPLQKIAISDVGNATKIWNDLIKRFIEKFKLLKQNKSIHLNYTGGTKVMGVHVYRFIEREMQKLLKREITVSFSYFDGRIYKVVDDSTDNFISDDLRLTTKITFKDIRELHGFKSKEEPDLSIISGPSMDQIKKEIDDGNLDELSRGIRDFYEKLIKIKIDKNMTCKLSDGIDVDGLGLNQFSEGAIFRVIRSMPEKFQFFDEMGKFDSSKLCDKRGKFDSSKPCDEMGKYDCPMLNGDIAYFIKFLNGVWLEHYGYYVLSTVWQKEDGASIENISTEKDWKIYKQGWHRHFQIDVILKKGFQLIGISCTTTTNKTECKKRGFEIIHRTRQMGGDESKAMLVTLLEETVKMDVQEELEKDSGCPEGHILVLGKRDIMSSYFLKMAKKFIK